MAKLYSKKHKRPEIGGVDNLTIALGNDEYTNFKVKITSGSRGGAWFNLVPPDAAAESVFLSVGWAINHLLGTYVEYEVHADKVSMETGTGRALLFEHISFEGRMLELSSATPSLTTMNFNDITSSIVVLTGHWVFYKDTNFSKPYVDGGGRIIRLQQGMYDWVGNVGLENDKISSLRPIRVG